MIYSLENSLKSFTFRGRVAAIFMVRCDAEGGVIYSLENSLKSFTFRGRVAAIFMVRL
jgi:hypothetical protein